MEQNMEGSKLNATWLEIKAKIITKWPKLSDGEVEAFKDNPELFVGHIEKAYGIDRVHADRIVTEFRSQFFTNTDDAASPSEAGLKTDSTERKAEKEKSA